MIKKIVSIAVALSISLVGRGDILLWQVTESTLVDGSSIQQFLVPYPSTDDSWPAARVKLISSDGTSSRILKVWGEDFDTGLPVEWDGDWGAEVADWGEGYGARDNHSDTGFNTITRV